MNIFVSYPSARRELAQRLKLALEAEQHEVFFDRDDLAAGEAYHRRIRDGVAAAELFVFLVTPESVAAGSYTLAELALVEQKWPRPSGRVLPVMVVATPMAILPPYLTAVTVLQPQGEPVAETVAAVARLVRALAPRRRRITLALSGTLLVSALGGGFWWNQSQRAARAANVLAGAAALKQCLVPAPTEVSGTDPASRMADLDAAYAALSEQAVKPAAPAAVHTALEDCAMQRLRDVQASEQGYAPAVAPFRPALTQGLQAGASGPRAADLRAHLGWADHLAWHDRHESALEPTRHYQRALQDDPGNAYAHAMWGHWLLLNEAGRADDALRHFEAARGSGRDTDFVVTLQLGALLRKPQMEVELLRVLQGLRLAEAASRPREDATAGLAFPPSVRAGAQRVWSHIYGLTYLEPERQRVLGALPPDDGLKTFLWLFPQAPDGQRRPWRLVHAQLLVQAGQRAAALPDLQALQVELTKDHASGPFVTEVARLLAARP